MSKRLHPIPRTSTLAASARKAQAERLIQSLTWEINDARARATQLRKRRELVKARLARAEAALAKATK